MSANESSRWKAVFAALNLSPVFDAVAMFAEGLAMRDDESAQRRLPEQLTCDSEAESAKERARQGRCVDAVVDNLNAQSASYESQRISPIGFPTLDQGVLD
jgi:hypothetical protein